MEPISYRRHRFPPVIIQHAVWLYFRFTLSYRDVEDLLAECGIEVSYESVRRWAAKFGRSYAKRLQKRSPKPHLQWHLDEIFVKIGGKQMYLWRAVDAEGEVLDVLIQSKRNKVAAIKVLRRLMKKHAMSPSIIVTDKWRRLCHGVQRNALPQERLRGGLGAKRRPSHFPDPDPGSCWCWRCR